MKIKNMNDLHAEKQRLKNRRSELEKAMKYDWRDFTESLKPGNVADQFFKKSRTESSNDFLKEMFTSVASRCAEKLSDVLSDKFSKWAKK